MGCIKHYEYWDIYYINWLAGFRLSTRSSIDLLPRNTNIALLLKNDDWKTILSFFKWSLFREHLNFLGGIGFVENCQDFEERHIDKVDRWIMP